MIEGSNSRDTFRAFVQQLLPQGVSGNLIIQAARDAGFGIRRADALGIIREERQASQIAYPPAFEPPSIEVITGQPSYRWGDLVQMSNQWSRFDGPSAILYQQNGPDSAEWTDFIIPPDDEDIIGYRFVVQDDEYVRDDGSQPGYRTSQSFDSSVPISEAIGRLSLTQDEIVRVIFDRP